MALKVGGDEEVVLVGPDGEVMLLLLMMVMMMVLVLVVMMSRSRGHIDLARLRHFLGGCAGGSDPAELLNAGL